MITEYRRKKLRMACDFIILLSVFFILSNVGIGRAQLDVPCIIVGSVVAVLAGVFRQVLSPR